MPKAPRPPGRSSGSRKGRAPRRALFREFDADLEAPAGLEASSLRVLDEELVVFRVPLARAEVGSGLSGAEREVAELAVLGLSNAEIARRRKTSERTVANQIASIFRKLGVGSRTELTRRLVGKGAS